MDPVTVLLYTAVVLFLGYVLSNWRNSKYKNFPPGPTPLPLIGNLLTFDYENLQKTAKELYEKYGPICSVQLGMDKLVFLSGYETIKDALINHADEFSDRPSVPVIAKMQNNHGIVFASGESWKVMRRFTISTLRDFGMGRKSIEEKIIEEAENLTKAIKSHEGKPFNNLIVMNAAVANIIVSMLLDCRFDYEDPKIQELLRLMNENTIFMGSPVIMIYNIIPSLMEMLPGVHQKLFDNVRKFHSFLTDTFTKKKKELDVNDQRNLIDAFLAKQLEGKPESTQYYHNGNLTGLLADLFLAGMETTSTTLRWGLLYMMKYPEIQQKVQNEIERVIGSAPPQLVHRKQMPYTDAVIHEIQRYADIFPTNAPHAASQDVTYRGYFIPKGTFVLPVLSSILRDKTFFERPEEFYPEHFLDSEGNFKKTEAFVPFSFGKRSCVGENLAKMELFLFFTTLLQNFTFQTPPGAKLDLSPTPALMLMPKPHELCAIPRR